MMTIGFVIITTVTDVVQLVRFPSQDTSSLVDSLMLWATYIKIASISSVIEAIVYLIDPLRIRQKINPDSKPKQAGQPAAREANNDLKLADHWLFISIDIGVLSMHSLLGVAVLRYRRGGPVWEPGRGLELGVDGVSYKTALVVMCVGKVVGWIVDLTRPTPEL